MAISNDLWHWKRYIVEDKQWVVEKSLPEARLGTKVFDIHCKEIYHKDRVKAGFKHDDHGDIEYQECIVEYDPKIASFVLYDLALKDWDQGLVDCCVRSLEIIND